ncbi:hypothetical protein SAMN05192559_105137 [Halobacillus karajensis]|uniref:Uncharacterized protein n=1 Tax=Halobacillus karajensis TaxID=195088 RepID=A0A024P6F7_9BACI|nr:hypothetical protein [Halobacillus karajensis]CDQ20594.1 hypothetical protein BN982_02944 [Halobacillus karajensis]CDQ23937.1 hypothetical protein BN983_02193 [Halobacillus karajensis]CDQ27415.1 hypothetical protein BN981_01674 [Halobacillus karajensis]SEH89116.1 hypothetical protein SAMN05192559_105137 [Halobacillus karajensis]
MKLTKWIFIGTVIYLAAFLIDYFVTLFSIDESGIYRSKLGLQIDMTMNEEELFTTFSLTTQVLFTYLAWLVILCISVLILRKFRTRTSTA